MRILVTGSRDFPNNPEIVKIALLNARDWLYDQGVSPDGEILLVHGAARGLDQLAARVASEQLGWHLEAHPAQWGTHTNACPRHHHGQKTCKMAGHRRNQEMIDTGVDIVVAFPMHPRNSGGSRGTWGCVDASIRSHRTVAIVDPATGGLTFN